MRLQRGCHVAFDHPPALSLGSTHTPFICIAHVRLSAGSYFVLILLKSNMQQLELRERSTTAKQSVHTDVLESGLGAWCDTIAEAGCTSAGPLFSPLMLEPEVLRAAAIKDRRPEVWGEEQAGAMPGPRPGSFSFLPQGAVGAPKWLGPSSQR